MSFFYRKYNYTLCTIAYDDHYFYYCYYSHKLNVSKVSKLIGAKNPHTCGALYTHNIYYGCVYARHYYVAICTVTVFALVSYSLVTALAGSLLLLIRLSAAEEISIRDKPSPIFSRRIYGFYRKLSVVKAGQKK